MIRTEVITCDCCGAERRSGNGWYILMPMSVGDAVGWLAAPLTEPLVKAPGMKHCCGQTCLHKELLAGLKGGTEGDESGAD